MKILTVDDHASARRIMKKYLSSLEDTQIFEAGNLDEARSLLATHDFQIAFIDIRLSDDPRNRDGQILVKTICQNKKTCVVVVISGLNEKIEINEAMNNGAQDYILKDRLTEQILLEKISGLNIDKNYPE